ncbi:MAG: hypothetical protein II453_09965 [Alphaproteobacteria bacterium]|nr:hypothetical protein [Alphaproteobacteria bacterium]MBQ3946354.1 hypothetical protein [Alphaproteobacteria bacterium]
MAKKKVLCDTCVYFNDKCVHCSNLIVHVRNRLETIGYKSEEKKSECEFYKCLEN